MQKKASLDWHRHKFVERLGDKMDWKMIIAKISLILLRKEEKKGKNDENKRKMKKEKEKKEIKKKRKELEKYV